MNNKIVVALGRNAFGDTIEEQKERVKGAAKAIADLIEMKYEIVITHSNGPQIGMIQTAMTEFARLDNDYGVAPMSVCGAMSQGFIGYDLQSAIRTELLLRGIYKPVATVITQVRVDPFDKAFNNPTKVIGRYMNEDEAHAEEHKGNYVVYEEGKGYRRVIAAPKPIDIYEIDAVRALLSAGQIVIAGGGGGIPVLEQRTGLKGASAIIEKDYTACKLAEMIDASTLLFLTSKDNVLLNKDTPEQVPIKEISAADARKLICDGHFKITTSRPKMDAAISFVEGGKERRSIITHLNKAKEGVLEKVGTIIK